MGKLIRMISEDGAVVVTAVNSTDIADKIEKTHVTSAVITAALGRLCTAASMMGFSMKGENDSLTLRINGGGASGSVIAVANSKGNVKGYVQNPIVELPLNQYGKLDVKGAVGTDGTLSVIKDMGLKEPYIGQIPIASGEIAEDITSYYYTSEQTPTVCGLGVLVNRDLSVRAAGGFLLHLLPYTPDSVADSIEENMKDLKPVSTMIDEGMTPRDICEKLLAGMNPQVLEEAEVAYKCDCSKEKMAKGLISIGRKDLQEIIEEDEKAEVCCHFCNNKYNFTKVELLELLKSTK